MNPQHHQEEERLTRVEGKVENMENGLTEARNDIKEVKNNHLLHLSEDMAILKTKMSTIEWVSKAVAGTSVASLAGSILNLILK